MSAAKVKTLLQWKINPDKTKCGEARLRHKHIVNTLVTHPLQGVQHSITNTAVNRKSFAHFTGQSSRGTIQVNKQHADCRQFERTHLLLPQNTSPLALSWRLGSVSVSLEQTLHTLYQFVRSANTSESIVKGHNSLHGSSHSGVDCTLGVCSVFVKGHNSLHGSSFRCGLCSSRM